MHVYMVVQHFCSLGKFKRSRLKLLKKEPGTNISFPSDFRHTITVQHLDHKTVTGVISPRSPPGSPGMISRLQAIARKCLIILNTHTSDKNR